MKKNALDIKLCATIPPHLHHHHHLVLPPPLFFALQKMMDETTKCFTNLKLSKKGMCRFLQRTPKLSFKSTCPI